MTDTCMTVAIAAALIVGGIVGWCLCVASARRDRHYPNG